MNDMIICIGRQYGSGGREVGEKLAKRLGVTCYDKLLLKQAAKEGGVSLGEVERQDEKPVSASAFLSGNVFADSASIGGAFYSQSQLVYDAEKKAILDAAAKGGCVIIGRCASSILRKTCFLSSSTRMRRIAWRALPGATGLMNARLARGCARWTACVSAISIFTPIRSGAIRKAMM